MTATDVLFDERAITRALSRFARIADGKNFDELGDVFADDVLFDYGSGHEERGLPALRELQRRTRLNQIPNGLRL